MAKNAQRLGGSFAPPIDEEKLSAYQNLFDGCDDPKTKDALNTLARCAWHWLKLPDSEDTARRPHPVGVGTIVPLSQPIMDELFDDIPWDDELEIYQRRLDSLPEGDLRNAAFHVLWFVKELNLDREPITSDLLDQE